MFTVYFLLFLWYNKNKAERLFKSFTHPQRRTRPANKGWGAVSRIEKHMRWFGAISFWRRCIKPALFFMLCWPHPATFFDGRNVL